MTAAACSVSNDALKALSSDLKLCENNVEMYQRTTTAPNALNILCELRHSPYATDIRPELIDGGRTERGQLELNILCHIISSEANAVRLALFKYLIDVDDLLLDQ